MENNKCNKDICITLLREKQASLMAQGLHRFVQRGDFTEEEVVAIKAYLGPWPRALEGAGIKIPRPDDQKQRACEKRIRAKRQLTKLLKEQKSAQQKKVQPVPTSPVESIVLDIESK